MEKTEFKTRMDDRLRRWYRDEDRPADPALAARRSSVASLVNKTTMADYAQKMGLPLPQCHALVGSVDQLDFSVLPERIVIKPSNSADNDCVMLFAEGREVFTGDAVPVPDRADYVREAFRKGRFTNEHTQILAEEFIQDYDPRFVVPRDFKVYVVGGKPWITQVVDRTGPKKSWTHRFYDRSWTPYPDNFQLANKPAAPIEPPAALDDLYRLSEQIAADINCFMRLDFYLAARGVVFGEFTSYPNAGLNFSPQAGAILCDLMDSFPDPF